MLAPLNCRSANTPSGSMGSGVRCSRTTNPTAETTPMAAETMTSVRANVSSAAISAYVMPPRARAPRTAPATSKRPWCPPSLLSGTWRPATARITGAILVAEGGLDQRQAPRGEQRPADPLEGPRGDELTGVLRQPGQQRGDGEPQNAQEEDPAPSVAVAKGAAQEDQRRERQR